MTIKVAIIEDDPDFQDYLSGLISDAPGLQLVFSSDRVSEATQLAHQTPADLYLVDLQLTEGNGVDFVKAVKSSGQKCKALILTVLGDKASVLVSFEAGANGYLLKDTPPNQVIRDIHAVMGGGNPISPQAATHLLTLLSKPAPDTDQKPDNILTKREQDVLLMFSRGLSYKETAESMNISRYTVSDYVKSIYSKLSVHSRNEAIFEAVQNGWLDI